MRLPRRRRPSGSEQAIAAIQRDVLLVHLEIQDRLSPILRRAAVQMERFAYAASGEWNRYQMVGAR